MDKNNWAISRMAGKSRIKNTGSQGNSRTVAACDHPCLRDGTLPLGNKNGGECQHSGKAP